MARIIGYAQSSDNRKPAAIVLLLIAFVLTGLLLFPLEVLRGNILSIVGAVAVILSLIGLALNRTNPMLWKKIIHKKEYEELSALDAEIHQALQELDDQHSVLCNFNFELLHVDFLVLGPKGIAVIGRCLAGQPLQVADGVLMTGEDSLEKATGDLWRRCHLINLVIKKGYSLELMPKPILVLAGRQTEEAQKQEEIENFDGIAIVPPKKLIQALQAMTMKEEMSFEKIQGFAAYLEQRYIR